MKATDFLYEKARKTRSAKSIVPDAELKEMLEKEADDIDWIADRLKELAPDLEIPDDS